MSDNVPIKPINQPIVIDKVHEDRGKSGKSLKNCFFLPTEIEGFYDFFNSHGRTLATGVSSANPFPFLLDGNAWTIYMGKIDDFFANGRWTNTAPTPLKPEPGSEEDQDGSFQASSGPGMPTETVSESLSADPPTGAIVIRKVFGDSDKEKLKDMYFLPSGINNMYNLYNKNGKWLLSGIVSGTNFSFPHDSIGPNEKISWTITNFVISDTAASGHWSNPDNPAGDQSGSFQASSGPGADTEATSAASAS